MNIIQIKGIVPGAGKTHLLIEAFIRSELNHKIILTPTNKARQEVIQKLIQDYAWDEFKASAFVKTLRSFKRNYVQGKVEKEFDLESNEWIDKKTVEDCYVTIESTKHETRHPYNIFIDEVSMISKREMEDLINHWCIQNLITAGDINQFEPIGGYTAVVDASGNLIKSEDGSILGTEDLGEVWEADTNKYTICLNKSHRAKDEVLTEVLNYLKQGQLINAITCLEEEHPSEDCQTESTDWHIAYTNRKCDKLNEMYKGIEQKWIAIDNQPMWNFYKSEIWTKKEIESLHNDWITRYKGECTWEDWFTRYFKPAYGLTAHKLQGSTIKEGKIFIHLDDLLLGGTQDHYKTEDFAKLVQKFLYISISRAVSIEQVNIYCLGRTIIDVVKMKQDQICGKEFSGYEADVLETFDKLLNLEAHMKSMQEVTDVDLVCDSGDKEALDSIFEHLNMDESLPNWVKEKHESEMNNRKIDYSNRKIDYSNRKKKTCKYTDDYLLTFATLTDLRKITKAKSVIDKWKKLHN